MRWHYTTVEKLKLILNDQCIRVATVGVPEYEKPSAWFSVREDWEPTATKAIRVEGVIRTATLDEMIERAGGLARIGVADAVAKVGWCEFRKCSGIKSGDAKRLEAVALTAGALSDHWFVSFENIPADKWLAIEVCFPRHFNGGLYPPWRSGRSNRDWLGRRKPAGSQRRHERMRKHPPMPDRPPRDWTGSRLAKGIVTISGRP
jgi:hypothetical protein